MGVRSGMFFYDWGVRVSVCPHGAAAGCDAASLPEAESEALYSEGGIGNISWRLPAANYTGQSAVCLEVFIAVLGMGRRFLKKFRQNLNRTADPQ